ncbi:ABC transporter permease [Phytoactinopolyspora limicola]|uniref:ABC transporter permease n=1 Tax=Phytoactinopolyspora limicola TaxID=2715536 RepID=UPI00140E0124|nr:ABC transporter permease [Phytoactinopolyspora limicola]
MADLQPGLAAPPPVAAEAITTQQRNQARMAARRFLRHRLAVTSLVLFVLVVAFAFLGPLLWSYDHTVDRAIPASTPPSMAHPFGTTTAGQDVMGQVMRGTQQSLKVALTVALISTTVGSLWGAVAGLYGGWVDNLMMRFVDVILVVPLLVLVTAMAGNVRGGTSWWAVALVISAFIWTGTSRVVRGVVLSLREQEFIEACRAMGASNSRIVLRHLIPNAAGPIIVAGTLAVAFAILAEAALSFLGFGIQPPDTSLGLLIENARAAPFTRPWLFYPPGVFIVLIALTINFVGDGMRDALDPRQTMTRR